MCTGPAGPGPRWGGPRWRPGLGPPRPFPAPATRRGGGASRGRSGSGGGGRGRAAGRSTTGPGAVSQVRVVLLFPADCRGWTVAGEDDRLLRLDQQLVPDPLQQRLAVAVREVAPPDRAGEERVAREEQVADLQRHTSRPVAGRVEH